MISQVNPQACTECLRRARLLAHLAPYIEKIATGTPGRRSPELLRLGNEDLAAVAAPQAATKILTGIGAVPEARLRDELTAAECWACCRHDPLFPVGLGTPPMLPWALFGRGDRLCCPACARRGGNGCRVPAGQQLRTRGGTRARQGTGDGRTCGRQRPRFRHRRLRPSWSDRLGLDGRGPRLRRRRRLPCRPSLALAADRRARPCPLRAAARNRRLALVLPRPQPDHGGAVGDDRRGRGGGAIRLADHRRPCRGPGKRSRRRAGARRSRLSAGPTTSWPGARASSATLRTCSTRCLARACDGSSGPARRLGAGAALGSGGAGAGCGDLRRGRDRPRACGW